MSGVMVSKTSTSISGRKFSSSRMILMVGYSSLFASVLGVGAKNIEQLCEGRLRSSHFLPSFKDQKPETTGK